MEQQEHEESRQPLEILRGCIREEKLASLISVVELMVDSPSHLDRDELLKMQRLLGALRIVRGIAYPPSGDHHVAVC